MSKKTTKTEYLYYMLIVQNKNNESIDKALKLLKSKVIKTKQNQLLTERKEYKKKSVRDREKILSAKYKNKILH